MEKARVGSSARLWACGLGLCGISWLWQFLFPARFTELSSHSVFGLLASIALAVAGILVGDAIRRLAIGRSPSSRPGGDGPFETGELTWCERRKERKARKKEERKAAHAMDDAATLWI